MYLQVNFPLAWLWKCPYTHKNDEEEILSEGNKNQYS